MGVEGSFTPTKMGGGKSFSHAEGGGGHNKFPPFKGILKGGDEKSFTLY